MIVRSVVVLPAPLRPTRQMASLSPALSVTLRRIWLASMKTSTSRSSSMRAPHHRRHDGVIGLQLGGAAVGEHAALVQGHDAVGIAEDDVHVVLDLDDGVDAEAGGGLDEHLHDRVLVGGAHAAGRLVEQDDLRVEGERAGHVEQLLVALGQRARGPRERVAEAEQLGHRAHLVPHAALAGERGEEPGAAAEPREHGDGDRLAHRESGEDVDELEGARHAEPGQPHGPHAADVLALEAHGAARGRQQAREDVDERRLAGAVGADDRHELAAPDPQRDAVEGADAAVEHPYVDRLQQRHAGRSRASRPSSPPGKKMTTPASSAPKTKRQYAVSDITASCRKMKTTAPTTGPRKWWKPPSSSMKTRLPECVQYASCGSARPVGTASSVPPTAPNTAAITKA